MANHFAPQWGSGWELLPVLGIGVAVIVALAAAAGRWTVSAAWQAAVWRIATLSAFVLLLFELTGLGQGVVQLCRWRVMASPKVSPARQSAEDVGEPLGATHRRMDFQVRPTDGIADVRLPTAEDGATDDAWQTNSVARLEDRLAGARTDQARAPCAHVRQAFQPDERRAPIATGSCQAGKPDVHEASSVTVASASPAVPVRSRWLAVVWAMGTAAVLVWLLGGRVAAWFFRRNCTLCEDQTIRAQLAGLQSVFDIRRAVALLASPRVAAPVVLGGWRPALVLPSRFTRDFDPQQQATILAHELAHVVSRDPAWQAAALVLCALLWWHPLAWWLRRRLRAANEALADEASLVVPDGPRILAEALVLLGQRLVGREPRFGLSLEGSRFRSGLGRRVQRLLSLPRGSRPRAPCTRGRRRARLAFAHFSLPVLVALVAIFGTAIVPSQVPLIQGETTMSVLSNSWRSSLVATALWTMLAGPPAGTLYPRSAAADDQPEKAQPTATDREKAERQLHTLISQKIEQLEKEGKHEEADRLKLYEVMMKAQSLKARASSDSSTSSQPVKSGPEVEKLRDQLKYLSQKIRQLEQEGKQEDAEKLKREARAAYLKINPRADGAAAPGGPERQKLHQDWLALRDKIAAATKEGKQDEVRRLKQEADILQSKLYPQGSHVYAGPSHPQPGGDRAARLQHLRSAAENLKAAGCEPEAQHVMQMIQRLQAEGSTSSQSGMYLGKLTVTGPFVPQPVPGSPPNYSYSGPSSRVPAVNSGTNPTREDATVSAVKELRSQVEQMRREMRELREQLKRVKSSERPEPSPPATSRP
jgi:hypothetical protein